MTGFGLATTAGLERWLGVGLAFALMAIARTIYGVFGSAAPIDDGAMPLDHSVKAWEDTKTYLVQGEHGYDGVDPDVWFLDDRSAERAGFDHAG